MQDQVQKSEEPGTPKEADASSDTSSISQRKVHSTQDPEKDPGPGGDEERKSLHDPLLSPPSSTNMGKIEENDKSPCDSSQTEINDGVMKMNGTSANYAEFIISKDDPLCEDIISCISALDEMLAEFDDTSLPYTGDLETSCGDSLLATSDEIAVTDGVVSVTALHSQSPHIKRQFHPSTQSTRNIVAVNDNSRIAIAESVVGSSSSSSSMVNGNKLIDQNQNFDWIGSQQNGNNNGPVIHTSHLIQIPVAESSSSKSSSSQPRGFSKLNQNLSNKNGTSNMINSAFSTEMNGNGSSKGKSQQSKKPGNNGAGGAPQPRIATGGGTYSKGTSYEILIPKINPDSFTRDSSSISCGKGTITTSSSHSSRASIMVPVIESSPVAPSSPSNVGKARSQLNMGIFQQSLSQQQHVTGQKSTTHTSHVPVLAEGASDIAIGGREEATVYENQIKNNERSPHRELDKDPSKPHPLSSSCSDKGKLSKVGSGVSSTYISVSEGKSSLGHSNSSGASSAIAMMTVGDEEQWNFPSEKNLPRSLRKTRKTCFLDEGGQGDGNIGKPLRAESPYCTSSTDSNGVSRMDDVDGRNGSCHKSPRVMPRKGISKCEIVNKEDGHFALVDCANKRSWTGHNQQPAHKAVVETSSSSSPSNSKDVIGRGSRKKIYEDVVLSKTSLSTSPLLAGKRLEHYKNTNGDALEHSPSSSFSRSSGVGSSLTANPSIMEEQFSPTISSELFLKVSRAPKSKSNQQDDQQPIVPKPRVRQQIPSPGLPIPTPKTIPSNIQNQFVLLDDDMSNEELLYRSQISCDPSAMSSHHSLKFEEIGTEEEYRGDRQSSYKDPEDTSSNSSPIKPYRATGLRKASSDTEFEETASDSKILKIEEKTRRVSKSHSKHPFEAGGQNGSLPNQWRMVMMMKSNGRNTSSGSSRSASSSSSGSVSVKSSSSSSEHNCGDVFHENIVQDYPGNIFNVATSVIEDSSKNGEHDGAKRTPVEKKESESNDNQKTTVVCSGDVVVLRTKVDGNRGNLQPSNQRSAPRRQGANQPIQAGASNQPNTTLDIDDGYLSMINRNEAPLLWPEEFIENETFSTDELKRLSVHLPDDEGEDTDGEDYEGSSNSHSAQQKTKTKKQLLSMNKSSLAGSNGASGPGRSSTEKTDYFSDDSLEMDGDEEQLLHSGGSGGSIGTQKAEEVVVRASTSFIIPFHTKDEKQEQSRHDGKVRKSNSQISKIPKILSPLASNNRRSSSGSIHKHNQDSANLLSKSQHQTSNSERNSPNLSSAFRKPCSFFIPFADSMEGASGPRNDRKLSSGDNTAIIVNSAVVADSISLPTSKRTSPHKSHSRQGQDAQANPDSYCTDLNNTRSVVKVESGSAKQPDPPQVASSVSINNNNANYSSDKTRSDVGSGAENIMGQVVEITQSGETGSPDTDNTNRSSEMEMDSPTNIPSPNNTPNSTSIKTGSPSQTVGNTGEGIKSKRHKFEKQQTFIVSPFSDSTTSVGQRLIDRDDNTTNSPSPQQNTKLIITDQAGLRELTDCKKDADELTPDNVLTNDSTAFQPTHSNVGCDDEREDITNLRDVLKALDKLSDESIPKMISENNADGEKRLPPSVSSTKIGELSRKSDNRGSSTSSPRTALRAEKFNDDDNGAINKSGFTQPTEKAYKEEGAQEKVGVKNGDGILIDNSSSSQDHESVTEELESVVKMFLKATEGLLNPEEYPESKICEDDVASRPSHTSSDMDEVTMKVTSMEFPSVEVAGTESSENIQNSQELSNVSNLSDMLGKMPLPLMTSTPMTDRSNPDTSTKSGANGDEEIPTCQKRISFHMLSDTPEETVIEDLHLQPPTFIPEPPPLKKDVEIVQPGHHHQHSLDGKVALDILSQRITRNCPSPVENMSVSQFLHNKKNIWAMYDRPYDEDVLPQSFPRGYASRSQENLVDAMTHERLTKSFSARGQSSTLPLNCRPPPVQRRTSTFRNMFNKFRKHKTTDTVIPEGSELRDDEAQSITSRETGPSEGKKRGFFSRLFRRSRKH